MFLIFTENLPSSLYTLGLCQLSLLGYCLPCTEKVTYGFLHLLLLRLSGSPLKRCRRWVLAAIFIFWLSSRIREEMLLNKAKKILHLLLPFLSLEGSLSLPPLFTFRPWWIGQASCSVVIDSTNCQKLFQKWERRDFALQGHIKTWKHKGSAVPDSLQHTVNFGMKSPTDTESANNLKYGNHILPLYFFPCSMM